MYKLFYIQYIVLLLDIVQVADIRLKIVQNKAQLFPSLGGVDGLDRVGQLCQFGAAVEVHVAGISVHSVAHAAAFVFHAEILDFMALPFQVITQFEYVGFATTVGVEKLVDHKNSHTVFILFSH